MADEAFETVHISEIAPGWEPRRGFEEWRPVRHRLGIRAFGVNAWIGRNAGDRVIEDHTEEGTGHEELYVVIAGRATFVIGDQRVDAPPGTFLFIRDAGIRRVAHAEEAGTTILAVGASRGEAFEVSAWEHRELNE